MEKILHFAFSIVYYQGESRLEYQRNVYEGEPEELTLPAIEQHTAIRRAHLLVNIPTLGLFLFLFLGAAALELWPVAVNLVISTMLTAVYVLVAISMWQNWLSRHNVEREEALYWRKKAWLDHQKTVWAALVFLAWLMWLLSIWIT